MEQPNSADHLTRRIAFHGMKPPRHDRYVHRALAVRSQGSDDQLTRMTGRGRSRKTGDFAVRYAHGMNQRIGESPQSAPQYDSNLGPKRRSRLNQPRRFTHGLSLPRWPTASAPNLPTVESLHLRNSER